MGKKDEIIEELRKMGEPVDSEAHWKTLETQLKEAKCSKSYYELNVKNEELPEEEETVAAEKEKTTVQDEDIREKIDSMREAQVSYQRNGEVSKAKALRSAIRQLRRQFNA